MGLALGLTLTYYTSVAKKLKLQVKKFWGLIPTFVEVTGEKLLGGETPIHCKFLILIMRKKILKTSTQLLILSIFLLDTIVRLFENCWESQRDKIHSLWENILSYQVIFSFWERVAKQANKENTFFFVSLRLPLISPRYIVLKLNQKITTKISN